MAGSRKLLSANRALVLDTLHFARAVPIFPVEDMFDLNRLALLRQQASLRISWSVIFLKAYATVVASEAVLRQVFVPWPWPHFYEQADTVAILAMHRRFGGDDRLCWARFQRPECRSLIDLQMALTLHQDRPVDEVFRRQVRFSHLPTFARRAAWRIGLYLDLKKRAKRFGTFSISSLAGQGCINRFHPTIHTTSLTYGPLDQHGKCLVTLLCDHRVLDGMAAARALRALQKALEGSIADELEQLVIIRRAA